MRSSHGLLITNDILVKSAYQLMQNSKNIEYLKLLVKAECDTSHRVRHDSIDACQCIVQYKSQHTHDQGGGCICKNDMMTEWCTYRQTYVQS